MGKRESPAISKRVWEPEQACFCFHRPLRFRGPHRSRNYHSPASPPFGQAVKRTDHVLTRPDRSHTNDGSAVALTCNSESDITISDHRSTMMRTLYHCLLLLHPPAFRRRFAAEMLLIFEEAARPSGALALFLDGFVSLARQWLVRAGTWKLAAAVLGACIQVTLGGLIWPMLVHAQGRATGAVLNNSAIDRLMLLILVSSGAIVGMVVATSLWIRSFASVRLSATSSSAWRRECARGNDPSFRRRGPHCPRQTYREDDPRR